MGWLRAAKYIYFRIIRLSDSNHRVASGLATGAAISFSPILGTHFIQAGGIAYLLRFTLPASLIGTFTGNPWTFPFIWWAAFTMGSMVLSLFGLPVDIALPDHMTMKMLIDITLHQPLRIFLPWMIGGYLMALISWPIYYALFYNIVRATKAARTRARLIKMHKAAQEITGQNT